MMGEKAEVQYHGSCCDMTADLVHDGGRHGFLCTSCCDCAQYCKAAGPNRTDPAMQGHF